MCLLQKSALPMGTLLRDYSNSNNYHCRESHSSLLASGHVYSLSLQEVRVRTSLIAPCTPAPPPVSEPNPFQPKTVRNHMHTCARGRGCTSPFLCACTYVRVLSVCVVFCLLSLCVITRLYCTVHAYSAFPIPGPITIQFNLALPA